MQIDSDQSRLRMHGVAIVLMSIKATAHRLDFTNQLCFLAVCEKLENPLILSLSP